MLYYKKVLVGAAVMTLVFTTLAGCKGGNEAESSAMVSSAVSSLDEQPQKADLSNSAMLGNSYLDGFVTYNVLPDMDCFYRVGLNVRTVFTKTMLNHEIPVIDELQNGKSYDRVFLIFGENELGWPNTQAFYDGYGEVIDAVRERQPEAAVYIQSILPVSQEVSEKNIDCTNNEQILKFNEMLKELAKEKDAIYLDVASVMMDENGNLPEDAAVDGIHPGSKYYKIWAEYLEDNAILSQE